MDGMRLTRRGRVVVALAIVAGLAGVWMVSANLWWTGAGYCWGSGVACLGL